MIIVDTDVLIWYLRGNQHAKELLESHLPFEISAVTWAELLQGVRNKNEIKKLKALFKEWNVGILHIDENISVRALLLVTDFTLSNSLRLADALIAATAIEHQYRLLTANDKHYRCVPMLDVDTFRPNQDYQESLS